YFLLLLQAASNDGPEHAADPHPEQRRLRPHVLRRQDEVNRHLAVAQLGWIEGASLRRAGNNGRCVEELRMPLDGRKYAANLLFPGMRNGMSQPTQDATEGIRALHQFYDPFALTFIGQHIAHGL